MSNMLILALALMSLSRFVNGNHEIRHHNSPGVLAGKSLDHLLMIHVYPAVYMEKGKACQAILTHCSS